MLTGLRPARGPFPFRKSVVGEVEASMRDLMAPCGGAPLRRREACRSGQERAVIRSTHRVSPVLISTMPPVQTSWRARLGPEQENCVEGARNSNGTPRIAVSRVGAPLWQAQKPAAPQAEPVTGRIALTWSGPRPLLFKADIQQSLSEWTRDDRVKRPADQVTS